MSVTLLDKWMLFQVILEDPDLSPTAKLVAGRLLWHLNNSSLLCNPSYNTLARGIGLSRRRAMDGVDELVKAGWVYKATMSHKRARGLQKGLVPNAFAFAWRRAPSVTSDTSPSAKYDTSPSVRYDTDPSAGSDTQTLEPSNTVRGT